MHGFNSKRAKEFTFYEPVGTAAACLPAEGYSLLCYPLYTFEYNKCFVD